ncbi:MAG: hypothetical protein RL662_2074 [Bacteroidota bacterium]|jgi:hypothetical protein
MSSQPSKIKDNFIQLKKVFEDLLPKDKIEIRILLFFLIFYSSYGLILAINTSIIDYKDLLYDVYFSFDNPIIYRQGYVYLEGHPLMMFMTMPVIALGNVLATLLGYKAKTVLLTFTCTILISLSTVYVYRYIIQIIELKGYIVYLLVGFFGFTTTNLILSFTPESFTITTFVLSYSTYYYAYCIKYNKSVRLASNALFAVTLGGITITNFAKGIIPMLFMNDSKKIILKKIIIVSTIFLVILVWIQLQYDFINLIKNRLEGNISVPARGNYFEKVFEWLFAAPIFFPEIMMMDIKIDGTTFNAISIDFYHYWWQYAFAIILFICLAYSTFKNYRNPLVLIILFLLLEDIIIHAVIRYGIRDAFIYGGHWVYLVPILLGWMYQSAENNKKRVNITISTLFLMLVANNAFRLIEFIQLSLSNFPPY